MTGHRKPTVRISFSLRGPRTVRDDGEPDEHQHPAKCATGSL